MNSIKQEGFQKEMTDILLRIEAKLTQIESLMGGRYIQLHISNIQDEFILYYAGIKPTEYPVEVKGEFVSPNSLWNRIYLVSPKGNRYWHFYEWADGLDDSQIFQLEVFTRLNNPAFLDYSINMGELHIYGNLMGIPIVRDPHLRSIILDVFYHKALKTNQVYFAAGIPFYHISQKEWM